MIHADQHANAEGQRCRKQYFEIGRWSRPRSASGLGSSDQIDRVVQDDAVERQQCKNRIVIADPDSLATQNRLALIPLSTTSFYDIAFAADNNRVLVGTWDTVEIADTAESMVVSQMTLGYQLPQKTDSYQGSASIGSLAMNSVRAGVASGLPSHDGSPQQLLAKLAVSTHNVVAVGDMGGNIGLWDLNSGKHLKKITLEQEAAVADLQFSPDGKWLAYYVAATLHIEDVSDVVSSHGPISESLTSVEASTISSADPTE